MPDRRVLAQPVLYWDTMRVGIPIWNGRVSPVLDTAERVVVVDTEAGEVREEVALEPRRLPLRAARIAELRLDLLVCGALSRPLAEMLAAAGDKAEAGAEEELTEGAPAPRGGTDEDCLNRTGWGAHE